MREYELERGGEGKDKAAGVGGGKGLELGGSVGGVDFTFMRDKEANGFGGAIGGGGGETGAMDGASEYFGNSPGLLVGVVEREAGV